MVEFTHPYTVSDCSYLCDLLRAKLHGFTGNIDLKWSRSLADDQIKILVKVWVSDQQVFMVCENETDFPSDEIVNKLRLLLL